MLKFEEVRNKLCKAPLLEVSRNEVWGLEKKFPTIKINGTKNNIRGNIAPSLEFQFFQNI